MLTEQGGMIHVEAAEVEELEGLTVDAVSLARPVQITLVEIPVGDVVGGISEYVTVEDAGGEVQPALVHEAHVLDVDLALAVNPLFPEVQERL
jgi:hypothetical protein